MENLTKWWLVFYPNGVLFVTLSSLFSVFAPQVVREAFDLIGTGIGQRALPVEQRHIDVPEQLQAWVGWTGIDLHARLNGALDDEGMAQTVNFGTKDTPEAIMAFVQKRPPEFQGR